MSNAPSHFKVLQLTDCHATKHCLYAQIDSFTPEMQPKNKTGGIIRIRVSGLLHDGSQITSCAVAKHRTFLKPAAVLQCTLKSPRHLFEHYSISKMTTMAEHPAIHQCKEIASARIIWWLLAMCWHLFILAIKENFKMSSRYSQDVPKISSKQASRCYLPCTQPNQLCKQSCGREKQRRVTYKIQADDK